MLDYIDNNDGGGIKNDALATRVNNTYKTDS